MRRHSIGHPAIRVRARLHGPDGSVLADGVHSIAQGTVIDPAMVRRLGLRPHGPRRCERSALGEFCGESADAHVALPGTGCDTVVGAVVAPLDPPRTEVIVGTDVLRQAQPWIYYGTTPATISCRRRRRRR